jgi:hypothetical protein
MTEKSQLDKFKAKARELECDEDEARFKANLRKSSYAETFVEISTREPSTNTP